MKTYLNDGSVVFTWDCEAERAFLLYLHEFVRFCDEKLFGCRAKVTAREAAQNLDQVMTIFRQVGKEIGMSCEKKPLSELVEQIVATVKQFAEENGGLTWNQVEALLDSRHGLLGKSLWDIKVKFL